jgi:hypothetical protein
MPLQLYKLQSRQLVASPTIGTYCLVPKGLENLGQHN